MRKPVRRDYLKMVCETDKVSLKESMPEYLSGVHGIADLRRPFRCLNPSHEDKHPSMVFYHDTNTVHCFSCGVTYDVFKVAEIDTGARGFKAQAIAVAEAVGYRMREDGTPMKTTARRGARDELSPIYSLPPENARPNIGGAIHRAFDSLLNDEAAIPAMKMLSRRGLNPETEAIRHGLGWAKDPNEVAPWFKGSEPSEGGYLLLPFYDKGFEECRYLVARPVKDNPRHKEYSPSGGVKPLYNEHFVTSNVPDILVVVEGVFDAWAMQHILCDYEKMGFPGLGFVALCGTTQVNRLLALTYHAKRRPGRALIALDNDEAGREWSAKATDSLSSMGIECNEMKYPDGVKDPNELLLRIVKNGGGADG
jgi:replicative DNA helicase